ncbi:MAG: tol-pal system protein YbgF [Alphaproteobacteria bacterium]|nr:tol-pal system protein YbgF [Alphaproteobacteria bacterium]
MTYLQRVTPIAGGCFVLALAVALIQPTLPAFAQSAELNDVRNEIARLQREVSALRRQIARGGARSSGGPRSIGGELPPTLAARMEVRLSQLEGQVSRMTGKIEEINHGIKQIGEKLDRAVSDIELRLSALEKGKPVARGQARSAGGERATARRGSTGRTAAGNAGGDSRGGGSDAGTAGGTTGSAAGGTGGGGEQLAKLPDGKPAEQYQYAMSLLRRGNHDKAAGALKAFIQRYPNGTLTGNAVYWLGESYYVRGQYREAAIHFAEGFKKFPKSPKASANLLKLGMSFGKLNKRREACASLYELRRRYPRAPTYIRRRAAGESRRLRCS